MTMHTLKRAAGALAVLAAAPTLALAQEEAPALSAGDTAWMLTATALVLFMTIPGLSLFYAGMVRSKYVLSGCSTCIPSSAVWTRRFCPA